MDSIDIQRDSEIKAVARQHPLTDYTVTKFYEPGQTVRDILDDVNVDTQSNPVAVSINGQLISPEYFDNIEPKPNTEITIRPIPTGGGGDNKVVSTVLSIAVLAGGGFVAGGAFGKSIGTSLFGQGFTQAVVDSALLFAVNSIFGPQRPERNRPQSDGRDGITPTITGSQNQANRYGAIPKVYGKTKLFPPYGATPVTEASGTDQYLRMLFVVGYGPLKISDIKIGQTDIEQFDDVELEVREGFDSDDPRTIYTNDIEQNDLNIALTEDVGFQTRTTTQDIDEISIDIEFERGLAELLEQGGRTSNSVTLEAQYKKTSSNNWKAIPPASDRAYTINWPDDPDGSNEFSSTNVDTSNVDKIGTGDGNTTTFSVSNTPVSDGSEDVYLVETETVESDDTVLSAGFDVGDTLLTPEIQSGDGTDYTIDNSTGDITFNSAPSDGKKIWVAYAIAGRFTVTNNTTSLFKRNFRWEVDKDTYDVRIRRLTEDADDRFDTAKADRILDDTKWSKLQSIRHQDPIDFDKNLATIGLRIKASDQLNGVIDRLSCKAESVLPNYDGNDWNTEETTRNPASHFRDVIIGNANSRDLSPSDIDSGKLEDFHDYCEKNDFEFNAVYEQQDTPWGVLQDILSSARADRNMKDGLFSLVFDEKKNAPVQHFTPRNTFDFKGDKKFPDKPDALKIGFRNENKDYAEDERIVYDDGKGPATADSIQEMKFFGVTDPNQIYTLGRYHLATMRLRPEKFTFKTDIEHIVCNRGDMVRLTHDIPQLGLRSGRVTSVETNNNGDVTAVNIDEAVDMDANKSYVARFRNADAQIETDDSSILVDLVTKPNDSKKLTFSEAQSSPKPEKGDLFQFGITEKESLRLLVEKIEPRQQLEAKITAVNYAPEVLNADQNIPDFESEITLQGPLQSPGIASVQSGDTFAEVSADGSITQRMIVNLEDDVDLQEAEAIEAQYKESGQERFENVGRFEPPKTQFSISPVESGSTYTIRVRKVSPLGLTSDWTEITHTVTGAFQDPPDVENFNMNIISGSAYLSWDAVDVDDLESYVIKHSPLESGASWENASTIAEVGAGNTSTSVPALTGTYMIKAKDRLGLESDNSARVITDITDIKDLNVVTTAQEDSDFVGTKTNMILVSDDLSGDENQLTLNGSDQIKDWDELSNIGSIAYGKSGIYQSGTYNFDNNPIDLGNTFQSQVSGKIEVTGQNVGNVIKLWDSLNDISSIGGADPSDYNVWIEVRTTDDDPNGSPTWSDWEELKTGQYDARGYEFRLQARTFQDNIRPKVTKLSTTVDMPDRTTGNNDVTISPSGTTITFDDPFNELRAVGVTIDNAQTGDYTSVTNKDRKSFDIQILDDQDNGVQRQVDWLATGFGKQTS